MKALAANFHRRFFTINKLSLGKINIPESFIYGTLFSILFSPLISLGGLYLWQIGPLFFLIIYMPYFLKNLKGNFSFLLFPFFFFSMTLIHIISRPSDLSGILLEFILFTLSYFVFLATVSLKNYFLKNRERLLKFINNAILITCIFGIYQFIGRKLNMPLTLDSYLRKREFMIGGFYQASSFFEEPAFFSQFLFIFMLIHLLVLKAENKKIIALILINIILTISVSAYVSIFILVFLFLIQNFFQGRSKNKFIKAIAFMFLLGISFYLFSLSFFYQYILNRIHATFIFSDEIMKYAKLPQGNLANVDTSGIRRVFGEIAYFFDILQSKYFLTGYGLNYGYQLPYRQMGLNAIVELILRWGITGAFLVLLPILAKINKTQVGLFTVLFSLFLYAFIDGAIAKVVFWYLLGILILSIEVFSFKKVIN